MCLHQNLEEESQGLKSSQDHVIKESIACRSEPADSDTKTRIGFLQIALVDNDKAMFGARTKHVGLYKNEKIRVQVILN